MKKHFYFLLSALALILSACSEELNEFQKGNQEITTINVSARNFEGSTRTAISKESYSVSWGDKDIIGIFPMEEKSKQIAFELSGGENSQNATFDGRGWGFKSGMKYAAYYPYQRDGLLDKTAIELDYTGQKQTANGSTDHLGDYDFLVATTTSPVNGALSFEFDHLGTLLHFMFTMPEAAEITSITLHTNGKLTERETLNLENNQVTFTSTSSKLTLNLENISLKANQVLDAYMMMAPTNLTNNYFEATVSTAAGDTYFTTLSSQDFKKGEVWNYPRTLTKVIPLKAEQTIPAVNLGSITIWSEDMFRQLSTQEMNEKVYDNVAFENANGSFSQGFSMEKFHEIYTAVEIVSLKKDGVEIIKDGATVKMLKNGALVALKTAGARAITVAGTEAERADISPKLWNYGTKPQDVDGKEDIVNDEDLLFGFLKDNTQSNTSYNIVWAMSPELVGTVNGGGSKFEIAVKYVSKDATTYGSVNQTFTVAIAMPVQTFNYSSLGWQNGTDHGNFSIRPIQYNPTVDGSANNTHISGQFDHNLTDWSHIEGDLMNGYLNSKGVKPSNLSEFIQSIRSGASVKFVFNSDRFMAYPHLSGFKTDESGTQLWYTSSSISTPAPATTDNKTQYLNNQIISQDYTDAAIIDYVVPGTSSLSLAATINNHLYTTASTNKNSTSSNWKYDEALNSKPINGFSQGKNGNNADAAYAIIRLHENDNYNATDAAKKLIGKKVPVKLLISYNPYNSISVQQFDVYFMEPLTMNGGISDMFTHSIVGGSYVSTNAFGFTDCYNYNVSTKNGNATAEYLKYTHDLYDYYCINGIRFDTDNATTSLSSGVHTDGYTSGPLLSSVKIYQMDGNTPYANIVNVDPKYLKYIDTYGNPLSHYYNIYINASAKYKWGELEKKYIQITVKP